MISALRTAVKNKAVTVSGITASNFFYNRAKDGQTGLYIVATGLPFAKEWSSENAVFYPVPVQFNIYDKDIADVESAFVALQDAFDFASLTVSGYTFIHCVPILPTVPATIVEDIWQATVTYMIEISKLRS